MKKAMSDFNLTAKAECDAAIATVRAEVQAEYEAREATLKEASAAMEAKQSAQAQEAAIEANAGSGRGRGSRSRGSSGSSS